MSPYQRDKLTDFSLFLSNYVKFYHPTRYSEFIEEGNYKGEYALKNAIFDILKYLFIVEQYMTEDFIEQAHERISSLYEDILYEENSIHCLINESNECIHNEKLLQQYQVICAIRITLNALISNAKSSLTSEQNNN